MAKNKSPASPRLAMQVEFLQKRMDENPQYEGLVALTNLHAPGPWH